MSKAVRVDFARAGLYDLRTGEIRPMENVLKILAGAAAAAVLSGCSTKAYVPSSTFQLPETAGAFLRGRAGLGILRPTKITVYDDYTTTPPSSAHPDVEEGEAMGSLVMDLGLLERLDVSFPLAGVSFQILGGDRNTPGWKAAVFAGSPSMSTSSSTTTMGGNVFSADTKTSTRRAGVSLGHRLRPNALVYATYSHTNYTIDTTVTQPSQTFFLTDKGYQDDASLGVAFGGSWFFTQLELNARRTTFSRTEGPASLGGIGLLFGGCW